MAILGMGEYLDSAPTLTNGQHAKHQLDRSGNLRVVDTPAAAEEWSQIAGSGSTTGKIGTVANTAKIYVDLDCSDWPVDNVDWVISSDQQFTYQFFRNRSEALSATITFADATVVDDGDTFVLNGVTWTAEATEEDVVDSDHMFWLGANNAEAAVNLAAALSGDYGPGVYATAAAVDATDVITIVNTTATTLQFGQGTSASNEIAYADTTLANLWVHAAVSANQAANSVTTRGVVINQALVNGWEHAVLCLTNTSGSAAATFEVRALRY